MIYSFFILSLALISISSALPAPHEGDDHLPNLFDPDRIEILRTPFPHTLDKYYELYDSNADERGRHFLYMPTVHSTYQETMANANADAYASSRNDGFHALSNSRAQSHVDSESYKYPNNF